MDLNRRSDIILLGFILLSLLLHLIFISLAPRQLTLLEKPKAEPVYIDLRPSRPLDRELDIPPGTEPEKPRETPAKRLGERNQEVKKETAPKGKDFEDMIPRQRRAPKVAALKPTITQPAKPTPPAEKSVSQRPSQPAAEAEPSYNFV